MEIQWSLVLFTALTGMGGCMFACVTADEFLGRAKAAAFPAAVAALVIAVVGGLASVTHLSHPDRIMGALSHPTSGIFTEALLVGCLCVCVVVYLVLVKREAAAGARKAVAVIGAVFGLLLSFMAGESYLMEARPNWCSQLLPLGYLLTAVSEGIAAYLVVVAAKAKGAEVTICDVAEDKLNYAYETFGLNHKLLNSSPEAFEKGVSELTGGDGFDVTIEAVGLPNTFQNCIDAVCFGGRVVLIGVSKRNIDDFFFTIIQKKELNVFGSRNAMKKDFLELIDLVKAGGVDLEKIVTNTYKMKDAPKAFEEFSQNAGKMLKVVIDFT